MSSGSLRRVVGAVGRFAWDFFVDDSPEMLVVAAVVVGCAYALRGENSLAVVALPVVVVLGLTICVWRALRPRAKDPDHVRRTGGRP
jgi:hypothetical protein